MKVRLKCESPEAIEYTIVATMTCKEWEEVRESLDAAKALLASDGKLINAIQTCSRRPERSTGPTCRRKPYELQLRREANQRQRAFNLSAKGSALRTSVAPWRKKANEIPFHSRGMGALDAETVRLQAQVKQLRAALVNAEAVMAIVEPRSDKTEYLACLAQIRQCLAVRDKPKENDMNQDKHYSSSPASNR